MSETKKMTNERPVYAFNRKFSVRECVTVFRLL